MRPNGDFKVHPQMRRHSASIDILILLTVLALIGIGCFFIYDFTVISSAVPSKNYYLMRQLMYAILGCASLMVVSRIDYHLLSQLTTPLLISIIMLNICACAVGSTGFIHWQTPYLFIGTNGIHVVQLTEIVVLLFWAQLMPIIDLGDKNRFMLAAFALLACFLPMLSSNLASTIALLVILCYLFYLANIWDLTDILASSVLCAGAFYFILSVLPNINLTWQEPSPELSGPRFVAAQSICAIADGGIFGVGVGHGMMRYAVEDVHGIYILPAITEEIGLIGAAVILFIYLLFLMRGFVIADRAMDRRGFYLAGAIMIRYIVLFTLYLLSLFNFLPQISGFSLPFISYGGTSLITECVLTGILLSIGRYQTESEGR